MYLIDGLLALAYVPSSCYPLALHPSLLPTVSIWFHGEHFLEAVTCAEEVNNARYVCYHIRDCSFSAAVCFAFWPCRARTMISKASMRAFRAEFSCDRVLFLRSRCAMYSVALLRTVACRTGQSANVFRVRRRGEKRAAFSFLFFFSFFLSFLPCSACVLESGPGGPPVVLPRRGSSCS